MTFFDDASITVQREDVCYRGNRSRLGWIGHMEDQPIAREDFLRHSHPRERAHDSYSALAEVSMFGSKYVYDSETGSSSSLTSIGPQTCSPTGSVDPSKGQYEIYSVATDRLAAVNGEEGSGVPPADRFCQTAETC